MYAQQKNEKVFVIFGSVFVRRISKVTSFQFSVVSFIQFLFLFQFLFSVSLSFQKLRSNYSVSLLLCLDLNDVHSDNYSSTPTTAYKDSFLQAVTSSLAELCKTTRHLGPRNSSPLFNRHLKVHRHQRPHRRHVCWSNNRLCIERWRRSLRKLWHCEGDITFHLSSSSSSSSFASSSPSSSFLLPFWIPCVL